MFLYKALQNIWKKLSGVQSNHQKRMPFHSHIYSGTRSLKLLGLAMRLPSYHHWLEIFLYPYNLISWHWSSWYLHLPQPDRASQVLNGPGTPGAKLSRHSAGKEEEPKSSENAILQLKSAKLSEQSSEKIILVARSSHYSGSLTRAWHFNPKKFSWSTYHCRVLIEVQICVLAGRWPFVHSQGRRHLMPSIFVLQTVLCLLRIIVDERTELPSQESGK
jgi:hypothetical protein